MLETVDPEFASYVDARQGRWLRTAYLVYGDLQRAEHALLQAFTRLSPQWSKADDPDAFVQGALYQPALTRWSRLRPFPGTESPVEQALAGLTSTQRTVLVLLHLEELTEFETADVLALSQTAVHTQGLSAFSAMRGQGIGRREDVGPVLAEVADDLPEVDLADRAWLAGKIRRRRRRRATGAGVLAALVVGLIVALAFLSGWLPVTG
ncbi:hypothetical protein [Kribbella sandramycini]|uniref:DNA-directed RNA polymerase specialized sigma24 family protein n=1 Tax=Kribbella sandramycini TaxID=60450 RepID=A0A841SF40_9ACTN|nr:hypothetical protein [Kribbella sandramycini]MBB6570598.1 DNA-directed RNA polymerase specialized sigma24 family protein [Kribbella sandramycini]